MPKIVTARRRDDARDRARLYLKSRLMLPTIPLGMVCVLAGYGHVALMWMRDEMTADILMGSTILFVCGAVWGWAHVRYERYLVATCPEHLARKQKILEAAKEYKKPSREVSPAGPIHPGRQIALALYGVGIVAQFGVTGYYLGHIGTYAALLLPWAGYFNAKAVFWRDLFARG